MLSELALLLVFSSITAASPRDTANNILQRSNTYKEPVWHLNPLRDRSKLKYEIVGIVGAYLLWTLATVLLIVFVRSRARRKYYALEPHSNTSTTMMKTFHIKETVREIPAPITIDGSKTPASLKSPGLRSLRSWTMKGHKSGVSVASLNSVVSHEQHKAQDMDDLTKLYEAVMVHDAARSQGGNTPNLSQGSPPKTFPLSPGYPPEFAHLHNANAVSQPLKSPGLPLKSPGFNQNFSQHLVNPMAPTPTTDTFAENTSPYYDPNIPSRNSSRSTRTTPLSLISDASSRTPSITSPKQRPGRISIRGQNITQPLGSADMSNAHFYDETVPLSPRVYNPGPPPPIPGKKKQVQVSVEPIYENDPEQYQQYQQQYQQPQQYDQSYPVYQREENQAPPVPPLPASLPKSPGLPRSPAATPLAQSLRDKRIPPSLALRANSDVSLQSNGLAVPSPAASKKLAFREMYGDSPLRSAPPTKTTFLDRPAMTTGSAPKTGVPYSPYTPFTPMTPITPRRLMNKQELKQKRKEERLKTLNEDDLVEDDEDMWGK